MKRKGFELSISAIVTIIISIVLLALGIFMLNKFIGGAEDIKSELDFETENQLSLLLESGERVALPFNTLTLRRGEQKVLGVGVLNIGSAQNFWLEVEFSEGFDQDKQPLTAASEWARYDGSEFSLLEQEQFKTAILFGVPKNATSGMYIFNVKVEPNYDLKKVYITVP